LSEIYVSIAGGVISPYNIDIITVGSDKWIGGLGGYFSSRPNANSNHAIN
jgi:hypothetical protein